MGSMSRVDATLKFRGSVMEAREAFRRLPGYLSGRLPDIHGIGKSFKIAFGVAMLDQIHKAYIVKSEGGTDDLRQKWKPLKPSTIAQRPIAPGDIGRLGIGGRGKRAYKNRVRGLLTADQDRVWRAIFYHTWNKLKLKMGDGPAKAKAAELAWAYVKKRMGAQTKLATLGTRRVLINRITDKLLASLEPGRFSGEEYSKPVDQIFETYLGGVRLGTKVEYAPRVHKLRPFWPSNYTMRPWYREATRRATEHLATQLQRLNRQ